jgi:hypothetical protein
MHTEAGVAGQEGGCKRWFHGLCYKVYYIDINVFFSMNICRRMLMKWMKKAVGDDRDLSLRSRFQKKRKILTTITASLALAIMLGTALPEQAQAQAAKSPYPAMAPLEQYLIADRNAEIAMARSAAPNSISGDAAVMVLGRHGYETAIPGKNGFVCIVERSWTAGIDDPDFWNPKLRGPICFNSIATRTYLPLTIKKTEWVLAGQSRTQMFGSLKAAFDKKELPTQEPGAMCYMLSKQANLGDGNGHWHPHLMFFVPQSEAKTWGANLQGSPILAADDPQDRLTIFMIPVAKWSDGTADSGEKH